MLCIGSHSDALPRERNTLHSFSFLCWVDFAFKGVRCYQRLFGTVILVAISFLIAIFQTAHGTAESSVLHNAHFMSLLLYLMLSADRLHVYRLTGCPSDLPLSVCMNSDSLVIFCTRLQPLQAGLRWGLNINSSNLACHKESAECCWSSSRQTSKSTQPWPDNSFSCTEWWYCSLTGAAE